MLKYVPIFMEWRRICGALNFEEQGRLLNAMLAYAEGEDVTDLIIGKEAVLWPLMQMKVDEAVDALDKKQGAGSKGGRTRSDQASASNGEQTQAEPSTVKQTQAPSSTPKQTQAEPSTPKQNGQYKSKSKSKNIDVVVEDARAHEGEEVDEPDPFAVNPDDPWFVFVKTYEQNIGPMPPSGHALEKLQSDYEILGADVIAEAIRITALAYADNPAKYFGAICADWIKRNIRSVDAARTDAANHQRKDQPSKARDRPAQNQALDYEQRDNAYDDVFVDLTDDAAFAALMGRGG